MQEWVSNACFDITGEHVCFAKSMHALNGLFIFSLQEVLQASRVG